MSFGAPPHFVQVGIFRAMHNAWNTSHRFGNVAPCKWCGCISMDRRSHYLVCLPMLECMKKVCPSLVGVWVVFLPPPCVPSLLPSSFGLGVVSKDSLLKVILWHDFLHHAFCTAKFSSFSLASWLSAFVARRRVWSRHSQMLHNKIDQFSVRMIQASCGYCKYVATVGPC